MVSGGEYTVRLERLFQGPMDLLLHLVREQEVEIHEIEISKILDGYLEYLDALDALDIEYAADFLVMAATLMAIKSRSLLPHEELDLEEELDPRDELIQRLIEYRRFRSASDDLDIRHRTRAVQHDVRAGVTEPVEEHEEQRFALGELTIWDLLATFSRLMRETSAGRTHLVSADPRPLRYYVQQVVEGLRVKRSTTLREMLEGFRDVPPREALVGSFCALLELVRMQVVGVVQEKLSDDIRIEVRAESEEELDAAMANSAFDEERVQEAPPEPAPDLTQEPEATAAPAPEASPEALPQSGEEAAREVDSSGSMHHDLPPDSSEPPSNATS